MLKCLAMCVCLRMADLTICLIQVEQCFMFGFNENKQLRAQCLSSHFSALQLNLISSWDISLITLRLRGGKKSNEVVS